jgi:phosphoribosylaminoimidazole-succinocarboxamide synthase
MAIKDSISLGDLQLKKKSKLKSKVNWKWQAIFASNNASQIIWSHAIRKKMMSASVTSSISIILR